MIKVEAVRNVHGSDWIKFRRFFDPTHYGESKKIQPNLSQPNCGLGWVGLNS